LFSRLIAFLRSVIHKMLPYKSIEQAEHIESPLSVEMITALDLWYQLYLDQAPWLKENTVKSMNLPAFICSEIARQVVLELKWNITGKAKDGEDSADVTNPRSEYLKAEFEKLFNSLREKLEQGCAAGGMTVRPYQRNGHIYFDWTMAWSLYPLAFGNDGELTDVIFRDTYTEGKTIYTRLERHTVKGANVEITQRAFKSNMRDSIGTEIDLTDVEPWKSLKPKATVTNVNGQLFGWYKVATANSVDVDSPMGASVYAKSVNTIKEADMQYSRLLWEYEGSELAVDVDPSVLKPKKTEGGGVEMPKLNQRLFRAVDADKGDRDLYEVFSPAIRDANLITGLNQLLIRIEDQCGLSRGTLSDANVNVRTATELKIVKQRSYATISDNQKALERCLRDVVHAMDVFASLYELAPEGEYDLSFEWDDSIITDTDQQMNQRLALAAAGIIGKAEMRQWYFGETSAQAQAAIEAVREEQREAMDAMLPALNPDDAITGVSPGAGTQPSA